jgi:hypothetical protein
MRTANIARSASDYKTRKGLAMSLHIDADIPGGNIIVVAIDGRNCVLRKDLRDTAGQWFYWKFRARFDEAGDYHFQIGEGPSIGPRGPAVSCDAGLNWEFLGRDCVVYQTESFVYHCAEAAQERLFCVCIPYLQSDLERFLQLQPPAAIRRETLCRSRQGREVELLGIGEPAAPKRLLLTSRHHANESMANFVIEGIITEILAQPEHYRDLFTQIVPFVDKDGVENGDQGKNRRPHDHNRDYGPLTVHIETRAIMHLVQREQAHLIIDLHCPWLRGKSNEEVYFVGKKNPRLQKGMDRFSQLLSEEAPPHAPYFTSDNLPFGCGWNTSENYSQGMGFIQWAGEQPWEPDCMSVEIPFATIHDLPFASEDARDLGRAFARSIRRFLALDQA